MYKSQYSYTFGVLILILSATHISAQSPRKILREANQLIDVELYSDAVHILGPLVREDHPEATLLTGFSLMASEDNLSRAIEVLQKSTEIYPLGKRNNEQTIEAHFYLSKAHRLNSEPIKALEHLHLLEEHNLYPEITGEIKREKEYCYNMQKLKSHPRKTRIDHLGEIINSAYEDHSPVVLYDESTIYFTSTRPIDSLDTTGSFFENIFESQWRNGRWTEPKILEIPGYRTANRATIGLTPDGQGLILFQNDGYYGSLFVSKKTFDGWSNPEPLPAPINSGFNETHASFAPDGKTIYFTSERPGGYGGKDIYISNLLPDGNWGEPINAGDSINTPMDEESPFIHANNETLYFSSSGHNSMGGYDVFSSKRTESGEWTKAENVGYPVNTPNDDVFYLPTPNGQRVYFSSRRDASMGQSDLFVRHFPTRHQQSMAVVSSHVFNSENQPAEDAIIRVINKSTNEEAGVYRAHPHTGKFIAIVPAASEYAINIESEGYQTHTQSFDLKEKDDYRSKNRAIYLPAITLRVIEPKE